MKILRRETDIFSTSFLDVIACGFGAVLTLVIIAKDGKFDVELIIPSTPTTFSELESDKEEILSDIEQLQTILGEKRQRALDLQKRLDLTSATVIDSERKMQDLNQEIVVVPPEDVGSIDSEYAGGVPVGREYVVFIIDTSGSMQSKWDTVVENMKYIILAHPKVTGLQIMNDNGSYLLNGYEGRWIPDTKAARNRAIEKLSNWASFSNSSPAAGLERALKIFAGKGDPVSIFVVGDDFTGASYQDVINTVDRWNIDSSGKRSAVIHGIGFPWGLGDRFATLMREVAHQNNGVFVGL